MQGAGRRRSERSPQFSASLLLGLSFVVNQNTEPKNNSKKSELLTQ
jgi:hypothetical protein